MASEHIDLKIRHQASGITRKIVLPVLPAPSWPRLVSAASQRFEVDGTRIALRYVDRDGDLVTLSSQTELDELWDEIKQGVAPRESPSPVDGSTRRYVRVDLIELPPPSLASVVPPTESNSQTAVVPTSQLDKGTAEASKEQDDAASDDEWVKPESVGDEAEKEAEEQVNATPEKGKERAREEPASEDLVANTASASFASIPPFSTEAQQDEGTSASQAPAQSGSDEPFDAEEARQLAEAIRLSTLEAEHAAQSIRESTTEKTDDPTEQVAAREKQETVFVNDTPSVEDDPVEEVASIAPSKAELGDVDLDEDPAVPPAGGVEADAGAEDRDRATRNRASDGRRPGLQHLLDHPLIASTPLGAFFSSLTSTIEGAAGPDVGRSLDDLWSAVADIGGAAREAAEAAKKEVKEMRRRTREAAAATLNDPTAREPSEAGIRGFEAGTRFAGGTVPLSDDPAPVFEGAACGQPAEATATTAPAVEEGADTSARPNAWPYSRRSWRYRSNEDNLPPWCRRNRRWRTWDAQDKPEDKAKEEEKKDKEDTSGEETERTVPGGYRHHSHSQHHRHHSHHHGRRQSRRHAHSEEQHHEHKKPADIWEDPAVRDSFDLPASTTSNPHAFYAPMSGEAGVPTDAPAAFEPIQPYVTDDVMPGGLQENTNRAVHADEDIGQHDFHQDVPRFRPAGELYGHSHAHEAVGTATSPMQYGVPGGFDGLHRRPSDPVPTSVPHTESYNPEVFQEDQGTLIPDVGVGWHRWHAGGANPHERGAHHDDSVGQRVLSPEERRRTIEEILDETRRFNQAVGQHEPVQNAYDYARNAGQNTLADQHQAEMDRLRASWQDELATIRSEHQALREEHEAMRRQAEARAEDARSESRALSMQIEELLSRQRSAPPANPPMQAWGQRPYRRGGSGFW